MNVEVHVTSVTQVWLDTEGSLDLLSRVDSQVIPDVEDSLFPVCVGSFRGGSKSYLLVRLTEVYTEVRDKGVHVIVTSTT